MTQHDATLKNWLDWLDSGHVGNYNIAADLSPTNPKARISPVLSG
jgi:hypothetical protein